MAALKKCPNCGSEQIMIDGVIQRQKKGLFYYLSGAGISDSGRRAGYKTASKLGKMKENAECLSCGHTWEQK